MSFLLGFIESFDTWLQSLNVFETCMFIMLAWCSATFVAYLLAGTDGARRSLFASTLMFGSAASTFVTVGIIVLAGLRV